MPLQKGQWTNQLCSAIKPYMMPQVQRMDMMEDTMLHLHVGDCALSSLIGVVHSFRLAGSGISNLHEQQY